MEAPANRFDFLTDDDVSLSGILDCLPYPFLVAKMRNGLFYNLYVNPRFQEEMGYNCKEIPTLQDWFQRAYPEPSYRAQVMLDWDNLSNTAAAAGGDQVSMQALIHTKNFGNQWYEIKNTINKDFHLVAFLNIDRAVSRQNEMERANANKGKILSILSHDLRSTIANLHSLSSLMLKHRLSPDEFKENLKALNMQALRIIDFFENLLTWTKSNFNKVNVNPSEIDLKNLIGKILTIYESPIHLKGISVRMQIKHGEKLQSERGILEIVIRNLISNAIKFTHDQGRIMVKSVQKNNTVTISVEDTGTGMDAEMIAAVLNNTNAPAFGTRNEKGLGIGLTLCRELLTKIGGDLKIESTLGMGTKISIVLPTKAKP